MRETGHLVYVVKHPFSEAKGLSGALMVDVRYIVMCFVSDVLNPLDPLPAMRRYVVIRFEPVHVLDKAQVPIGTSIYCDVHQDFATGHHGGCWSPGGKRLACLTKKLLDVWWKVFEIGAVNMGWHLRPIVGEVGLPRLWLTPDL